MTTAQAIKSGQLFIVATPIGNQDDITLRALSILKSVDFIIAEDTRHSASLCHHLGIHKPMTSLHSFNELNKSQQLIDSIQQGQTAALISDAGTPLISDPGFPLVKLAREQGVQVIPIPGANALITALSAAGIPCDSFSFGGFLPAKQAARQQQLEEWAQWRHTLVFYESKHRIEDCLQDIAVVFGDLVQVVLVKELTKLFEHFQYGTPSQLIEWLRADANHGKGEFVLILPPRPMPLDQTPLRHALTILLAELPLKQAVKLAVSLTGENKNSVYELALELKAKDDQS